MAHVRTQIRDVVKDTLASNLPIGYEVFASRRFAKNHTKDVGIVDIRILNENVTQESMGDNRRRVASLYIRVQRDAPEETLDDLLDQDEIEVTKVIEGYDWSDLLEEDPELVQVNFSGDGESSQALGAIILRYDVEYRVDKTNPEVVEK